MDSVNQANARGGALDIFRKSLKALKWYEWLLAAVMVAIALKAMLDAFIDPGSGKNPAWLTAVNFVSALAGVLCVFFCAKASVSNYLFGLVNTAAYIVYLWYWHIWGTFGLEVFLYLPMGVVGWVHWARHRDEQKREITKARALPLIMNLPVALGVAGLTVGCHALLSRLDGAVQWLDAMTVAIGITATLLQTLRYREQYVWWLITDVVAVAMYIAHFDPVYLTKKSIYLIVAVIGLINWIRLSRKNGENA